MVRPRRAATRRTQRSRARLTTRALNRRESGFTFSPKADPPTWTAAPWWPFTLFLSASSNLTYKATSLDKDVSTALGWDKYVVSSKTVPMAYRIQSVRAYGLASQPIQLDAYELVGGTHIARSINDMGGKFTYSAVGYRWGAQSKFDILTTNNSDTLFYVGGGTTSAKVIVYLQLLVRAVDPPSPIVSMTRVRASATGAVQRFETQATSLNLEDMVL